jgi:hypothetical protein
MYNNENGMYMTQYMAFVFREVKTETGGSTGWGKVEYIYESSLNYLVLQSGALSQCLYPTSNNVYIERSHATCFACNLNEKKKTFL